MFFRVGFAECMLILALVVIVVGIAVVSIRLRRG
jgi:hypothetical protein